MFGRLKLALVALVLMPAVAFAADHAPRHSPGASSEPVVATAKIETVLFFQKHRALAAPVAAGPSTVVAFLDGLGDGVAILPAANTKRFASFGDRSITGRHTPA